MGAPITAFTRLADDPIDIHSEVYEPDAVVVLDSSLIGSEDFIYGLKEGGILLLNTGTHVGIKNIARLANYDLSKYKVYGVPATEISVKFLRRAITNTAMLGALIRVLPVVKLDTVIEVIRERFKGPLAEANVNVVREAFEGVGYVA